MKEKNTKAKRDASIDFWRGMSCLSVLLIHTVFHSGNSYVPIDVACCFLFFDVPVFMALAGMTFSYSESITKKIKEILNIIKKWIIFICISYIILLLIDKNCIYFKDIFSWLIFIPTSTSEYIISLKHSLYFLPYYIQATLISSIILHFIKNKIIYIFQIIFLLFFILVSLNYNVSYFWLSPAVTAYCIFFLIGYLGMKINFKNFKVFVIAEGTLIIMLTQLFRVSGLKIGDLQYLKSVMNYVYLLCSLISIFFVIYVKDKFKYQNKFLRPIKYIGKNAINMFFAQGISSSLLYKINNFINIDNLGLKILTMFLINVSIAIVIFIILTLIYKIVDIIIRKITDKIKLSNIFLIKEKNI